MLGGPHRMAQEPPGRIQTIFYIIGDDCVGKTFSGMVAFLTFNYFLQLILTSYMDVYTPNSNNALRYGDGIASNLLTGCWAPTLARHWLC